MRSCYYIKQVLIVRLCCALTATVCKTFRIMGFTVFSSLHDYDQYLESNYYSVIVCNILHNGAVNNKSLSAAFLLY